MYLMCEWWADLLTPCILFLSGCLTECITSLRFSLVETEILLFCVYLSYNSPLDRKPCTPDISGYLVTGLEDHQCWEEMWRFLGLGLSYPSEASEVLCLTTQRRWWQSRTGAGYPDSQGSAPHSKPWRVEEAECLGSAWPLLAVSGEGVVSSLAPQ